MKYNDTGDFCVLYVEPMDEKTALFTTIIGQKKPVVLMLAEQVHVLQRPNDFTELKHVKRQLDQPIAFVAVHNERLVQLANRNGFPVYPSMDALAEALAKGHMTRQRSKATTMPLDPTRLAQLSSKTEPLTQESFAPNTPLPITAPFAAQFTEPRHGVELPGRPQGDAPPIHEAASDESSYGRGVPLRAPLSSYTTAPNPPPPLPIAPLPPHTTGNVRKKRLPTILVVLTITALLAAALGSFLVFVPNVSMSSSVNSAAAPTIGGHLYFLSSEQLSENSSRGIADEVQLDLSNVHNPAAGKSYYAWLLTDKSQSDTKATLVGTLPVNNGNVHFLYSGDAQHTNLLAANSRLLVTEEDATVIPLTPSPDEGTWIYYGEISSTPIANTGDSTGSTKTFSYLDHLRHLLASDPLLDQMELPGGLNNWLYRNTGKILEWTGSMREHWEETPDVTFIRRQTIRTLSYLDGLSYVQQDVPPTIPLGINDRLGRIGLLPVNGVNQDPPAYLTHLAFHLNGLLQANTSNKELRTRIAAMIVALNNVRFWLMQVRKDSQQLLKMSDSQLHQPTTLSLLNDMIANANFAYVGQPDTTTGEVHQGVSWVHSQMQSLAVIAITKYSTNRSSIQMIKDTNYGDI